MKANGKNAGRTYAKWYFLCDVFQLTKSNCFNKYSSSVVVYTRIVLKQNDKKKSPHKKKIICQLAELLLPLGGWIACVVSHNSNAWNHSPISRSNPECGGNRLHVFTHTHIYTRFSTTSIHLLSHFFANSFLISLCIAFCFATLLSWPFDISRGCMW